MENKRPHGGSHNTFIFGVLIGVLITLLITTKKGRRLLKVITDEGIDKITHWEDIVGKVERKVEEVKGNVKEELYEDEEYEDESVIGEDVAEEPAQQEEIDDEPQPSTGHRMEKIEIDRPVVKKPAHKPVGKKEEVEPAKPKRRLFKGIRKKTS